MQLAVGFWVKMDWIPPLNWLGMVLGLSSQPWFLWWIKGAQAGRKLGVHREKVENSEVEERRRGSSIKKRRSNVHLHENLDLDVARETLAEGRAVRARDPADRPGGGPAGRGLARLAPILRPRVKCPLLKVLPGDFGGFWLEKDKRRIGKRKST